MIHVFTGTKAQLIKMAPIIKELERREIPYRFLDTGQHARTTAELREQFDLRPPDVVLRPEGENIQTFPQALGWTLSTLRRVLFNKREICQVHFQGQGGVCLIHGDTLSTLFSLLYAKRCGLNVAHVEAGLRSYHLFDPFPEEIIRLIAMRFSDILYAPSAWAAANLQNMGYGEKTVSLGGNTIVDALRFARSRGGLSARPDEPYVVAAIHRVETIYSRRRMEKIAALLARVSAGRRVLFVLHDPTRRRLEKYRLLERLEEDEGIQLLPLQPYLDFVNLLAGVDFVITDGGSIQEEAHFLNVPCLIMRSKTERQAGLGTNACLAEFDDHKIDEFLASWERYRSPQEPAPGEPTARLVDHLQTV